ncbi:MAG TPA: hypothetical protein VFE32_04590 [Puia sp.]|jgi:hypothetical protein|nr:hypothetical protein [Puia sp.]
MQQRLLITLAFLLSLRLTHAQTTIQFRIDAHGNVSLADSSALSGPRLNVSGSKLVFTITPVTGHQAAVTVPGKPATAFRNGQFTIPDNLPGTTLTGLSNKLVTVTIDGNSFNYVLVVAPATAGHTQNTPDTTRTPAAHQPYALKTIYYDALALSTPKYLTKDDWVGIIRYYYGITTNPGFDSLKNLVTKDSTNPYLANNLNVADSFFLKLPGSQSATVGNLLQQGLSAAGGLDVTSIADGFAKFLVKRTKQELTIAFFSRFKDLLNSPKLVDLRTVFPQTYQALTIIGDEIYNYQGYIQTLRECFEKDLSALLTNLPTVVTNHPDLFKGQWLWLKAALQSGFYIAQQLRDKTHPGQIIGNFPIQYLDSLSGDMIGAIKTLQLVSSSLRDTVSNTDSSYWVNGKQVQALLSNTNFFRIYLGLLCQESKTIKFPKANDSVSLHDLLVQQYNNVNPLTAYISNFTTNAVALSGLLNNYKKATNDSIALEQYYTYFNAAITLLQSAGAVNTIPAIKAILPDSFASRMQTCFTLATDASNLALDINRRNYSSAILNATAIYNLVRTKPGTTPPATNDDPASAKTGLFQFGSFMAALVQAKTSDDVESAIESFALPSGSSRVKRESAFNVSLNAYTGFFAGQETIRKLPNNGINSYGVTAPIGVAISWGGLHFPFTDLCQKVKQPGHWSFSLFVSVIDLGAVASFRFNDTVTSSAAQIQLKDIISPGAFLSIGIPKCPLSVNLGAQVGPNLRKVYGAGSATNQSNDYANQTYWRFSASLLVDIPLLNFYTRPQKTK